MDRSVIAEGKTTKEAIEKGIKMLNANKDQVETTTLEETEKRSFYSILSPRVVKVEVKLKDGVEIEEKKEEKEEVQEKTTEKTEKDEVKKEFKEKRYNKNMDEINQAKADLEAFFSEFFKNEKEIEYKINIIDFEIYIDIQGNTINHLIGYRGETINALQTILMSIANKKSTDKIKIYLDIAGYKEKRIKTLEDLAEKIAKTVIRTKKTVTLEPMTAYERKIIHTKLQNNEEVKTLSKGEEPYRKVVITLK